MIDNKNTSLTDIPWLSLASEQANRAVRSCLEIRDIPRGTAVHRQGDELPEHQVALCGLLTGLLRMELATDDEGHYTVGMLREGAWFGAADYILQRSRLMSIHATDPCCIAVITRPKFDHLLADHPELWRSLALVMSRNVEAMLDRISAVTTYEGKERLFRVLVSISGQPLNTTEVEPAKVEATQEELAVATNLTSRTIRKLLLELQGEKRIACGYREIRLL